MSKHIKIQKNEFKIDKPKKKSTNKNKWNINNQQDLEALDISPMKLKQN